MLKFDLISVEKRSQWHCYYCGQQAKYIMHIAGAVIPVCNVCAAKHVGR